MNDDDGLYFCKVDEQLTVNSPGMNTILVDSTRCVSSMIQKDLNSLDILCIYICIYHH